MSHLKCESSTEVGGSKNRDTGAKQQRILPSVVFSISISRHRRYYLQQRTLKYFSFLVTTRLRSIGVGSNIGQTYYNLRLIFINRCTDSEVVNTNIDWNGRTGFDIKDNRWEGSSMLKTDVAIIGGGMAGTMAAAMLGRMGHDAILIDPHQVYPPDFRCEKLDESQVDLLRRTGLADSIFQVATRSQTLWIGRLGRAVEKRPSNQYCAMYDAMVNAVRGSIGGSAGFVVAKAAAVDAGPDRQIVTLSNGDRLSARLVVLANGLNSAFRSTLGFGRQEISPCHSISAGFDTMPARRRSFEFGALTYYVDRLAARIAYLSLFPIGETMRANLFFYRDMRDPWLRRLRHAPQQTLLEAMPGLHRLTGDFDVPGFVNIRPADLYVTTGRRRDGVVLVGDAFATSCPAAGTGFNKLLTDVERLCNGYVPRWLATPGMGADKLATFYADPVKMACDASSAARAERLRKVATDRGVRWRAWRGARLAHQLGAGAIRQAGAFLAGRLPSHAGSGVGDEAGP